MIQIMVPGHLLGMANPLPVGIVGRAFVTSRRQPQMPGRLVTPVDLSILKTFASGDLRRFPTRPGKVLGLRLSENRGGTL